MDISNPRRRRPLFVTQNACTECRKKRSKCDGRTPCGRCATYNVPNCVYEVPTRRSKEEMRSEIEQLRREQQASQRILDALLSNNNSSDVIRQLRNGEALEHIMEGVKSSSISASNGPHIHYPLDSTESTLKIAGSSSVDSSSQEDHIHSQRNRGQHIILGDQFDSSEPLQHHGPTYNSESWTSVTSDEALVEHLIALYFCWEYPICATVSQEHFMDDFRKGRRRYCSSLLVNALSALASRFSDQPGIKRAGGSAAGDDFFEEARRLLNEENDYHELTTIQALGVMSIREASCGRIRQSLYLSAESIRVAIEMGLNTDAPTRHDDKSAEEAETEKAVREATFWGAFSLNEILSLCTGSLPQGSRYIKLPVKPAIIGHIEDALWVPYTDDGVPLGQPFDQRSNLRSVYKTFCELSERVHNALYTLYSRSSSIDKQVLIATYHQYIQWYDTIPDALRLGLNFTPAVLFAHLFYHAATLLLFQPFINLKLTSPSSEGLPRDVWYQAANNIDGIIRSYADLYTLRRTPSFVPYFVLLSSVTHLVAIKWDHAHVGARDKLSRCLSDLEEMATCHGFADRALKIIRSLADHWAVEGFTNNTSSSGLHDSLPASSISSSDPFCIDISSLASVQRLEPVSSSTEPSLFSPFAFQGLPSIILSTETENGGFTIAPPNN